jgi:Fe-S-cluster containining protein
MKSIKSICSECCECCKRYSITLLPEEAKRIREKLNLNEKDFIREYCDLILQFFPSFNLKNPFVIHSSKTPKKVLSKLRKHSDSIHFFVLPNISLKKEKYCVFLENGLCAIHSVKPMQCKLFPFISLKKETSFQKKYPFCNLLKEGFVPAKNFRGKSLKHYKRVKEYFDSIKREGFVFVWKFLPEKCFAFFEDKKLNEITQKEFLEVINHLH